MGQQRMLTLHARMPASHSLQTFEGSAFGGSVQISTNALKGRGRASTPARLVPLEAFIGRNTICVVALLCRARFNGGALS